MSGRLVNVRLDERRLERARRLRARGIPLSKLVRDAIDREYEHYVKTPKHLDVEAIMQEIYQQYRDGCQRRDSGAGFSFGASLTSWIDERTPSAHV